LVLTLAAACGKKGDPTLRSYEKPDAPSSLTALHREDSIILRWSYPRSQEGLIAEFIVLRSTGTGFEVLSHLEKGKRIFTDKDIRIGSTFRYKIICRNYRGIDSNESNTVSATPAQSPPPPRNLSYTIKNKAVLLSWEPLNIGEQYNIYKADDKGTYGLIPLNPGPLSVPEFKDAFNVNTIVHYTVRSLTETDVRNEGPASNELIVNPADLVPPRPENLQAFPSADRIFLSWSEPSEPWVTGFRVYKRTGNTDYLLIGQTQIPTFVDQGPSDMKRDYRVTAVGPEKEGPAAEIGNVIFIPQR
jgi:hypothetical protein